MPLFDGYIAVDWSARTARVRGANSIWIAVCDADGPPRLENPPTREAAMEVINTLLTEATANERRLLCGFDFPFGYPRPTAQMLTGRGSWDAVWGHIAGLIQDNENNQNNAFGVAAELNELFAGDGPFWGHGENPVPGIPRRRPEDVWGNELATQISIFRMLGSAGAGSVEAFRPRVGRQTSTDRYRQIARVARTS